MKRASAQVANYFKSLGIKKGDRVMLVLKRHYQFWYSILALHKLGAIAIPATNLLQQHDFEYRYEAAGVSALVCLSLIHIFAEGNGLVCDTPRKCSPQVRRILELSAYYNTGCVLSEGKPLGGNATDRALLECAMPFRTLSLAFEKRDSVPFDSAIKFSAVHIIGQQEYRLVKGAPEKILPGCRYYIDERGNTKEFHPEKIQRLWRESTKNAIRVIDVYKRQG